MKKIFCMLVLVLLLLTSQSTVFAAAGDSVSGEITFAPDGLAKGGVVAVTARIRNTGGNPISNIQIKFPDGSRLGEIAAVAPGEDASVSKDGWRVSDAQIGVPLSFDFTWTDVDGKTMPGKITATVGKQETSIRPSVSLAVKQSSVEFGEKAVFTIQVHNDSNVELTDAFLSSPQLNGGRQLGDAFRIQAGETITKTWEEAPAQSGMVQVVLTYKDPSTQSLQTAESAEVDVQVLGDKRAAFSAVLSAANVGTSAGNAVACTLDITNTGATELKNFAIAQGDEAMQPIGLEVLKPGGSRQVQMNYTVQQNGTLQFTVYATDPEGTLVTALTNEVEFFATQEVGEGKADTLELSVKQSRNALDQPGKVSFTVTLTNNGTVDLQEIVVQEPFLGELQLAVLPAGASKTFAPMTATVKRTTGYQFYATGTTADGVMEAAQPYETVITVTNPSGGGISTNVIWIAAGAGIGAALLSIWILKRRGAFVPRAPKEHVRTGREKRSAKERRHKSARVYKSRWRR